MKKKLLISSILMTAVAIVMISCSKDDDDDSNIPDDVVGTWVMDGYYKGDDTHTHWFTYEEDGIQETTITLKKNGKCSGKGMLINGEGDYIVKTGNKWNDGYWAIFQFVQNGSKMTTATLTSFDNDRLTGYVEIDGYDQKLFIFRKQ